MKIIRLFLMIGAWATVAHAVDTTPPTLSITHTWIEKRVLPQNGQTYNWFSMYLDPQDETGMAAETIWFRSKLNTFTIPANTPWVPKSDWKRGERFELGFQCTSCVIEIRSRDAAGNESPVQTRTFASPFPFSPAPNLTPQIIPGDLQRAGSAANVRGLFVGRFDGVGTSDDLVQVDRATGNIMVRRQRDGLPVQSDVSFSLPADTIEDSASADFDTDSRADLAIIAAGALTVYHNDALDGSGVVQFGAQTVSLAGTGITTFRHLAVGDVTGDGKLDIVVSGTDAGSATRIGVLVADAAGQYTSSIGVPAPAGSTPGKLALGDMNGDGTLDVVMVDAAQNQMIVFKNKGATGLAGDGEVDVNYQPALIPTGLGFAGPPPNVNPIIAAPVRALVIGDVTGDGRADIVTVITTILGISSPSDQHTVQQWRLYENKGAAGFRPLTNQPLGQSPDVQAAFEDIPCDVLLMELNNDRFPEILFTNYYNNSVRILRFTALLDSQNFLTTLDDGSGNPELDQQEYVPVVASGPALTSPSRLAKGKLFTNASVNSIAMAFGGSDAVRWELNVTRTSTKTQDVQGGTVTDSDDTGVEGANGLLTYNAFVGENITSSLTAINNSATELTNVFLDVIMPANCSLDTGFTDPGSSFVTISAVKYLRWTVTVPANSVVIKNYRLRILTGTVGSTISSTAYLRRSNTVPLANSLMPKVLMKDPVQFRATVETESDSSGGDTAHAEEWIRYRMTMTNLGDATVSAKDLVVTLPANTTHLDHSADSVLGVTPVIKVGSTSYSPWKPNATIALNQKVIGANNQLYQCTANGISGMTEPTWPIGLNATVNDGTAMWKHLTTYSRWLPNAAIALNQKVIGANTQLYQCTKSGISGLTEPTWPTGLNTNDGTAIWKHIGPTAQVIASISWSGFDLPPDDPMTGTLENERTIEVRVLIKAGLANGTKITRGLTTFTRSDNTKQTAPAWTTTVLNPLEITLAVDKTIARPGELVRYTLNIHNWAPFAMTNCKIVNVVPPGMVLFQVGVSDGADSGIGGTGHFNQFPGLLKDMLTPTSSPISLDVLNTLTWNLGTVPGRVVREIKFDVQVQQDVPTDYYTGGILHTMELSNFSYNFVGNNKAGARLFAQTPTLGATLGSSQTAASLYLLASNTARHTQLSADTPLDAPNISLLKTFDGDGRQEEGGETVDYLVNDIAVTTDGIGRYALNFDNRGIGYARTVVIRDYVPTGMAFQGRLLRDGNPMSNNDFNRCRFYDSTGKLLVQTDTITDTNGNGFADAGEGYTDTNGNGKFDGFTAAVVRSMDLFAGNVPGTTAGFISYQVQTTSKPGSIIVSLAGGMSGVKDGLSFTALVGYHLKADNLRFPTNGSPKQVKVVITVPAKITMPLETVRSRSSAKDNEATTITIPYEVTGASGLTMSGLKMEFDIPKGYSILVAQVLDTLGRVIKSFVPGGGAANTITVTTSPSTGITHITFPLDGNRIAWPVLQVAVNALTKAALIDTIPNKGYTKAPMTFKPVMTGSYEKPITASARFASARSGVAAATVPPPVPLAAVSSFGALPVLVDSTKDSRIFVGRCAPVAVTRFTTFNYTIFVGNLTTLPLGAGKITMKIPAGCEGISMTRYSFNALRTVSPIPPDLGGKLGNVMPALPKPDKPTNGVYDAPFGLGAWTKFTWKKALPAGTTVTWDVGSFLPSEGGVATLTVRVLESFTGDRIDDNTCVFDVENALARTAGPLSVAVRVGTEEATSASLTQRSLEGMQLRTDTAVMNTVGQSFQLGEQSCHITIGGADALLLTNGVATIPLPNARMMVAGPPDKVNANGFRLLLDHPMMRVACGPGSIAGGVELKDVPSYTIGMVDAGQLFLDLKNPGANIVAGGGGNIVAGGGGNIVAAGGGNLQNASAAAGIIVPDGSPAVPVSTLVATSGAKLVGAGGSTLRPVGGGNLIGDGGGTIAAVGAKVVSNDGAGVVSNDGAGLIGSDGASLVGNDGASIVKVADVNLLSVHSGLLVKTAGFTQALSK